MNLNIRCLQDKIQRIIIVIVANVSESAYQHNKECNRVSEEKELPQSLWQNQNLSVLAQNSLTSQ